MNNKDEFGHWIIKTLIALLQYLRMEFGNTNLLKLQKTQPLVF